MTELSEKDILLLEAFTRQERKKGLSDQEIIQKIREKGIDRQKANYVVDNAPENLERMPYDGPSIGNSFFGLMMGIVVFATGVTITIKSKQVIAYGAILVGILWILRGAYKLEKALREDKRKTKSLKNQ